MTADQETILSPNPGMRMTVGEGKSEGQSESDDGEDVGGNFDSDSL